MNKNLRKAFSIAAGSVGAVFIGMGAVGIAIGSGPVLAGIGAISGGSFIVIAAIRGLKEANKGSDKKAP